MAFNKSKALESALKYLNQGKVAQAIGEYQQILRHDPKDQATLMTVGDLYARQGEMAQAIQFFERLAQVYLGDGFNSKAIAIYKKIAKLAPNELAPLERLADLYVQQGVLSEARPLFLQIAEAHLKANRAPKAVEVLQRLLDVEPENPRVQMRLAELYGVMGQKKEAAQTYLNYAQRLLERGEAGEAEKLAERAAAVDPSNPEALLLKAKALVAANKTEDAILLLEKHPDAESGSEVTNFIIDLELQTGQIEKAADRARKQLGRGSAHVALLLRIVDSLLEKGEATQTLPLLAELRGPMIEAGEQDKFLNILSDVARKAPDNAEPLEMIADFCRHSSDPFRLNSALTLLVDVYAAQGDYTRAETAMQEIIDRNKGDERLVVKLNQLRARKTGVVETPSIAPVVEPTAAATEPDDERAAFQQGIPVPSEESASLMLEEVAPAATEAVIQEPLDAETQIFIAQALTDVDLFSSYGLTQKATHLLEAVLERAPRHTPTLERLLDFNLGAGNERRTAELASQLEQIYTQRGDTQNAERFSELRIRFQTAAGMTADELPPAPPLLDAVQPVEMAQGTAEKFSLAAHNMPEMAAQGPAEFQIALVPLEEDEGTEKPTAPPSAAANLPASAPATAREEIDLSDEWAAMIFDVAEPDPTVQPTPEIIQISAADSADAERAAAPALADDEIDPFIPPPSDAMVPQQAGPGVEDFQLELIPAEANGDREAPETNADDLISELVAEFGDGAATPALEQRTTNQEVAEPPVMAPGIGAANGSRPVSSPSHTPASMASIAAPPALQPPPSADSVPAATAENLNQLSEVFQEFRSEIGEMDTDEDEDLETHYNLGIAYREMGLLDEAIGEFQKVAKAIQKGKPFAYAMNCSTLLALSFSDKGEPKIAALWYQRALDVPGLDQEAVLALRYDLGVSLETAGEASAALDSFRQVYAMNIDYRDVADRIAVLQKR